MRAAPAVRVTVQPPLQARIGVAWLAGLAAAAGAAWLAGHADRSMTWALAAAVPGVAAGWAWGPRGVADLGWDGQGWHCDGEAGQAMVQLDLHTALLLRWTPSAGGRRRWLLPHRKGAGSHWHALRVALFAGRAERPVDSAGQPPLTP